MTKLEELLESLTDQSRLEFAQDLRLVCSGQSADEVRKELKRREAERKKSTP